MTESFPQLRRLERLLNKAEAPCAQNCDEITRIVDHCLCCGDIACAETRRFDSPFEALETMSTTAARNAFCLDSAHSLEDVWQRPPSVKTGRNVVETDIVDSDYFYDVTCQERRSLKPSPQKRDGSRSAVGVESRQSQHSTRLSLSPMTCRTPLREALPKSPAAKRCLLRRMQEATPSDALDVLSDEEDGMTEERRLRCPLPTMPLAIMIPVDALPECIVPVDFETVLNTLYRFDDSIGSMMDVRNGLAQSYALFDKLCTSFNGFDNLDRFLRVLETTPPAQPNGDDVDAKANCKSASRSNHKEPNKRRVCATRSHAKRGQKSQEVSQRTARLLRPTKSSLMKQVDLAEKRSEGCQKTPITRSHSNRRSPMSGTCHQSGAIELRKRKGGKQPGATPVTEDDSREERMQRVRRGLLSVTCAQTRTSPRYTNHISVHTAVC